MVQHEVQEPPQERESRGASVLAGGCEQTDRGCRGIGLLEHRNRPVHVPGPERLGPVPEAGLVEDPLDGRLEVARGDDELAPVEIPAEAQDFATADGHRHRAGTAATLTTTSTPFTSGMRSY